MTAKKKAGAAKKAAKFLKKIPLLSMIAYWGSIILIIMLVISMVGSIFSSNSERVSNGVDESAEAYRNMAMTALLETRNGEYIEVFLSMMTVLTNGEGIDVMAMSEYEDKRTHPMGITSPAQSIGIAATRFAGIIYRVGVTGIEDTVKLAIAVQCFHMDINDEYMGIAKAAGKYTPESAQAFIDKHYNNVATQKQGKPRIYNDATAPNQEEAPSNDVITTPTIEKDAYFAELIMTMLEYSEMEKLDIDMSQFTYFPGVIEMPYFNQGDAAFNQREFYPGKTVKSSCCGPCCLAMVIVGMTGKSVTPFELAVEGAKNGYYHGKGFQWPYMAEFAAKNGLKANRFKPTAQAVLDALNQGYPVIAKMKNGVFSNGSGHYIVLRGVDEDGNILILDPGKRARNDIAWPLSVIIREHKDEFAYFTLSMEVKMSKVLFTVERMAGGKAWAEATKKRAEEEEEDE